MSLSQRRAAQKPQPAGKKYCHMQPGVDFRGLKFLTGDNLENTV